MPPSLEDAYDQACDRPSDISEHCPTLRRLSQQCQHATEFGVRYGTSTTALLAGSLYGSLRRLVSYDIRPLGYEEAVGSLAPELFTFIKGNSLRVTIEETDLLLIDSYHTGWQLRRELHRHHQKVRKWIVMHDTTLFGIHGEDGRKGLLPSVYWFLRRNPEWSIAERHNNNCGLMVLARRNT